jgi:hypothetical protein
VTTRPPEHCIVYVFALVFALLTIVGVWLDDTLGPSSLRGYSTQRSGILVQWELTWKRYWEAFISLFCMPF